MNYKLPFFITASPQHGAKVFCMECIPSDVDPGADDVQVWLERSEGWTAPQVCSSCGLSIPVFIGEEKEE
jgi:hypothetical protein